MAELLFEPLMLKNSGQTLKNRIIMSPMTTESAFHDGSVTDELIDYYTFRAGEAAAVIVESTFVEEYGRAFDGSLGIDTDDKIEGLSKLATGIKQKGSKAIIQLYHAGRMAKSHLNKGYPPISASPIRALRDDAEDPKEMSTEDIEAVIKQFGEGVRRAIHSGFDGVELHGANTFLIQQFFSPHSNRRTDKYGGNLEGRLTFGHEILRTIERVKNEEKKKDFIIGYRFSPEELEKPGIRFEDTMDMLNSFSEECIDYFHFSLNDFKRGSIVDREDVEYLIHKYHKQKNTKLSEIPVMGSGGIWEKKDALEALDTGFNLVSIGKAHIVNPDWMTQIKQNKPILRKIPHSKTREDMHIPRPFWNSVTFLKE